jgi:hypothetical protein
LFGGFGPLGGGGWVTFSEYHPLTCLRHWREGGSLPHPKFELRYATGCSSLSLFWTLDISSVSNVYTYAVYTYVVYTCMCTCICTYTFKKIYVYVHNTYTINVYITNTGYKSYLSSFFPKNMIKIITSQTIFWTFECYNPARFNSLNTGFIIFSNPCWIRSDSYSYLNIVMLKGSSNLIESELGLGAVSVIHQGCVGTKWEQGRE